MAITTTTSKPIYRAAVLVFPGADILDYAGPAEILSHAIYNRNPEHPESIFSVETIARTKDVPVTTGKGSLRVVPTLTIAEALEQLDDFHLLIVPGGPPPVMMGLITGDGGESEEVGFIRKFAEIQPSAGSHERVLSSTCVGAFLLGAAGLLGGLKVTTHHMSFNALRAICAKYNPRGSEETQVVEGQRYVDAGKVEGGLRIVTSGGISSGLDSTLYLVELFSNRETAEFITKVMEYQRRQG